MAPTQKETIEKLVSENVSQKETIDKLVAEDADLRNQLKQLAERVSKLESASESQKLESDTQNARQTESFVRLEAVEDNLCQVSAEQQQLQEDQARLMLSMEGQQMYSRKQTLLLTGDAVRPPLQGEDTRKYVLQLLKGYLGISDLQPHEISACHRLRNPKIILVRFLGLHDSDKVYRARTKPKRKGLTIFESLAAERLSVVHMLRDLKDEENTPFVSYFTQGGKILARTSEDRDVKPVEIPIGVTKDQVRDLCKGKKVEVTSLEIRNHFRTIHASSHSGERNQPRYVKDQNQRSGPSSTDEHPRNRTTP